MDLSPDMAGLTLVFTREVSKECSFWGSLASGAVLECQWGLGCSSKVVLRRAVALLAHQLDR